MSTRIHNGLISHLPLAETHQRLIEVKGEMQAIALKGTHRWLAQHAASLLDRMALSDRAITRILADHRSVYTEIRNRLDEAHAEIKKGYRQPDIDFDAEVILFPYGDHTLLFPIIESSKQTEHLKGQTWCTEYGYWDNTDGPENLSKEEFKARGKVWDEVVGKSGVPAERGLSFQLSSNFDMQVRFTLDGIIEAMPSLKERVTRYVDEAMIETKIEELCQTMPAEEWERLKTQPYSMLMRARAMLETDKSQEQRAEKEKFARARLKTYTAVDLKAPMPNGDST